MGERFLGFPLVFWGLGCLLLALLFAFVVPTGAAGLGGGRFLLARWGHAAVWALLALSCFARGADVAGPANLLAAAAGILYATYLAGLLAR